MVEVDDVFAPIAVPLSDQEIASVIHRDLTVALSTIYFENSTQPDRTWTYKNGKMNGTMTAYRRDGTIEHTVEYQDDYVVPGSDEYY